MKYEETATEQDKATMIFLRDMESLRKFSKKKLKNVKDLMTRLRKKLESSLVTLGLFKGVFESDRQREEDLDSAVPVENVFFSIVNPIYL